MLTSRWTSQEPSSAAVNTDKCCWTAFLQVCGSLWTMWVHPGEQPLDSYGHGPLSGSFRCPNTQPCCLSTLSAWGATWGWNSDPVLTFKVLHTLLCKHTQTVQVTQKASHGCNAGCGWAFCLFGFFPFHISEGVYCKILFLMGKGRERVFFIPCSVPHGLRATLTSQKPVLSSTALHDLKSWVARSGRT